ncbi:MAG TPA: glycosyltransferase [Solirubrobacterales bacterium]|nr:glycosyltransferase [Solirubrobacterales bacterium]
MSRPGDSVVEVGEVEVLPRDGRLLGCHLRPLEPDEHPGRGLSVAGWALAEERPVLGIELVHRGHVVARAPVDLPRPDIAALQPQVPHAGECGFKLDLDLLTTAGEVELEARAVLDPLTRVPIARLAARRAADEEAVAVTVVIPCFGQAHFLAEAIESVIAQTHPRTAVLVVDDGSHDNTSAVAAGYPGVECLRQENQGLAAARNAGLARVATELVLFLDADDRLLPEAIATGIAELRAAPSAVLAAGAWRLIGEVGEPLEAEVPRPPRQAYPALLESCFISTPAAVLYRRSLFEAIGGFDPAVSASADYDVYLRAAARNPVRLHGEVVAEYRRHGANMTRDPELIMAAEIAVLRRQEPVVARRPELREALARGIERSRAYHGERMG